MIMVTKQLNLKTKASKAIMPEHLMPNFQVSHAAQPADLELCTSSCHSGQPAVKATGQNEGSQLQNSNSHAAMHHQAAQQLQSESLQESGLISSQEFARLEAVNAEQKAAMQQLQANLTAVSQQHQLLQTRFNQQVSEMQQYHNQLQQAKRHYAAQLTTAHGPLGLMQQHLMALQQQLQQLQRSGDEGLQRTQILEQSYFETGSHEATTRAELTAAQNELMASRGQVTSAADKERLLQGEVDRLVQQLGTLTSENHALQWALAGWQDPLKPGAPKVLRRVLSGGGQSPGRSQRACQEDRESPPQQPLALPMGGLTPSPLQQDVFFYYPEQKVLLAPAWPDPFAHPQPMHMQPMQLMHMQPMHMLPMSLQSLNMELMQPMQPINMLTMQGYHTSVQPMQPVQPVPMQPITVQPMQEHHTSVPPMQRHQSASQPMPEHHTLVQPMQGHHTSLDSHGGHLMQPAVENLDVAPASHDAG